MENTITILTTSNHSCWLEINIFTNSNHYFNLISMFNKIRNPVFSIVTIIDEANEMLQKVNTQQC